MRRLILLTALLATGPALAQGMSLPPAERVVLDNGVTLILNEKHDVPMIGIEAVLKGGSVADPEDKAGIGQLYTNLVSRGAGDRDGNELADAVDSVGASFETEIDVDSTRYMVDFLARDTDLVIELLADMLRRPTLDRGEFESVRERLINIIRAAKDSDPRQLMPHYGAAFLFRDHAYGQSPSGNETTLANITHQDVRNYHRDHIGADRLVIVASGDFDSADMRAKLEAAFGDWRAAAADIPAVEAPEMRPGGQVLLVDKPGATQTHFWIGNVGVPRNYGSPAELAIANILFGGRFTSMLNLKLRTESGLTYGARSLLERPMAPGSVAMYSYTKTESTIEAIDMALGILGQLHDTGLDADMIDSGRNYFLGQFPPTIETAPQLASTFADIELYELGDDYIDEYIAAIGNVNEESIAAVVDDVYPKRDELVFVILGDAELVRDSIAKYGSVTEMSITEPRFSP